MVLSSGRGINVIHCPGRRKVHDALLPYIFKEGVLQFRVTQETITNLTVEIIPDKDYSQELEHKFHQKLRDYCGGEMQIKFKLTEYIPPETSGKTAYFISRLNDIRN